MHVICRVLTGLIMESNGTHLNVVIKIENDEIEHIKTEPEFYPADEEDDKDRVEINELAFLQGIFGAMDEERDFYVEDEEVDLNQINDVIKMEPEIDINDANEPYKDSNGGLYYICEECQFVCIDRVTLQQHTDENHSNSQQFIGISIDSLRHPEQIIEMSHFNGNGANSMSEHIEFSPEDLQKPYQCEICFKRLTTKANLRGHLTTHSNEKPFECSVCSKRFKQKRHLKYHQKTHIEQNSGYDQVFYFTDRFLAQYPGITKPNPPKPIPTATEYTVRHINVQEKPVQVHPCEFCSKTFTYKSNLNRHKQIHLTHKPFQCGICFKNFQQRTYLNEHIRRERCGQKWEQSKYIRVQTNRMFAH